MVTSAPATWCVPAGSPPQPTSPWSSSTGSNKHSHSRRTRHRRRMARHHLPLRRAQPRRHPYPRQDRRPIVLQLVGASRRLGRHHRPGLPIGQQASTSPTPTTTSDHRNCYRGTTMRTTFVVLLARPPRRGTLHHGSGRHPPRVSSAGVLWDSPHIVEVSLRRKGDGYSTQV